MPGPYRCVLNSPGLTENLKWATSPWGQRATCQKLHARSFQIPWISDLPGIFGNTRYYGSSSKLPGKFLHTHKIVDMLCASAISCTKANFAGQPFDSIIDIPRLLCVRKNAVLKFACQVAATNDDQSLRKWARNLLKAGARRRVAFNSVVCRPENRFWMPRT